MSRPSTPSSIGQVSNESAFLQCVFTVDLTTMGANETLSVKCDQDTSAGFLVHKVKQAHKERGKILLEKNIQLVIGAKVVQELTTKIVDVADTHNWNEHLMVTVVITSDSE